MIDVHHHIVPPFYVDAAREGLVAQGSLVPRIEAWSPSASLDAMDGVGIQTALLSVSAPGIEFGGAAAARRLARCCNEYSAELARAHPGRFGFFAALPLTDVEGSLEEIRYAFDELGAHGACLMTSYGDRWPGDPAFTPVLEELNRRKAVVFVHPNVPCACLNLMPGIMPSMVEFPFDTVRAVVSLLFSGALSTYRDVRFIFSHAGGALPSLAGRIEALAKVRKPLAEKVPHGVAAELARLYYDIAIAANRTSLEGVLKIAPLTQLLLGTDFPFRPIEEAPQGLAQLGLGPDEVRALGRGNALALLPRLAAGAR
jgi:predicted TIM-barrel fold metal-dependent hydrolase